MTATQIPPGDYLIIDSVTLGGETTIQDIHYTTNNPMFTDATGDRPGIRVVFSSDPLSADYAQRTSIGPHGLSEHSANGRPMKCLNRPVAFAIGSWDRLVFGRATSVPDETNHQRYRRQLSLFPPR